MGRNSTFLLDDGDQLRISENIALVYRSHMRVSEVNLTPTQKRETQCFASRYLMTGRLLGEGGNGKVLVAVDSVTQQQLACKIVRLNNTHKNASTLRSPSGQNDLSLSQTKKHWPTKVSNCFREFEILKDLDHPNIVSLEHVFWSQDTIYIFQELVTGGDLFSFLEYKGGQLDSLQAAVIIRQVLKGVEYMHNKDIVHRDLKPDNILMSSPEDGARVLITDFGNSRVLIPKRGPSATATDQYQRMFSFVGTLEFTAPEIHKAHGTGRNKRGYSRAVDMWSIGSITATILSGDNIFTDRTHPEYLNNPLAVIAPLAAKCDLSVLNDHHHPRWSAIGERPKDFIKRLLILDENDRLTASEALTHSWFACHDAAFESLYVRSIENWKARQRNVPIERVPHTVPKHQSTSRYFPPSQQAQTNLARSISSVASVEVHGASQLPLLSTSHVPTALSECDISNNRVINQTSMSKMRKESMFASAAAMNENSQRSIESYSEIIDDSPGHASNVHAQRLRGLSEQPHSDKVYETLHSEEHELEACHEHSREDNESYEQTQFPDECRQLEYLDTEEDWDVISETPPRPVKQFA